jgi:hypothetical protein
MPTKITWCEKKSTITTFSCIVYLDSRQFWNGYYLYMERKKVEVRKYIVWGVEGLGLRV